MAKRSPQVGRTSFLDEVFIADATSSVGAGKTGLTPTTGQLATPTSAACGTATTGGTLVAATYFYRISGTTASGETLACVEVSQVVPAGTSTNTVTVNWVQLSGATGYKVYGRTTGAEQLIAVVNGGATTTYVDTGSISPSGALPSVNTTGIQIVYKRRDQNVWTTVQPVAMTIGTWINGGLVELDAVKAPGMYQIGVPNAALASSEAVIVEVWGAVGVALQTLAEYELVAYNPLDATRLGLTALPNANAGVSGGVPLLGETLQLLDANDIAAIWAAAIKTGYALTTAEHTLISGTDVPAGLVTGHLTTARADKLDDLDATITSRMATFSYTAPDNSDIVSALNDLVTLLARTDPTTALVAIKAITDQFRFTVTNQVDANALSGAAATPTQVATALTNAGVTAAIMQQISALSSSSVLSGNVETCTTPDGHVFTVTYHPAADDTCTSVTVLKVS